MPKSPRKEAGSAAVKPKMAAAEALLRAREAGEGPVFSEEQQAKLTALCKLKNVDPLEFLTVYSRMDQIFRNHCVTWRVVRMG